MENESVTLNMQYRKLDGEIVFRKIRPLYQFQDRDGVELMCAFDEYRQGPRTFRLDRIMTLLPCAPTREAELKIGDKFDMLLNDKAGQAFPVEVEIISLAGNQVVFGTTSYPQLHRIVSRETFKELTE